MGKWRAWHSTFAAASSRKGAPLLPFRGHPLHSFLPVDLTDAGQAPNSPFTLDDVVRCYFMRVFVDGRVPKVFVLEDLIDGPHNVLFVGLVNVGEFIWLVDGFTIFPAGAKNHVADRDKCQDDE